MNTLQKRIKGLIELPSLRLQIGDLKLKLDSLEKIKSTISQDNYSSLIETYQKQIGELTSKVEHLMDEVELLKNEIELDSKILAGENLLVTNELPEQQFLFERGALSKHDYDLKKMNFQQKLNNNKSLLNKNKSALKELDFYSTYIGVDSYSDNSIDIHLETIKEKIAVSDNYLKYILSTFKSKFSIAISSLVILTLIIFLLASYKSCSNPKNQILKAMDEHVQWIREVEVIHNTCISREEFEEKLLKNRMVEKWKSNVSNLKEITSKYGDKLTEEEKSELSDKEDLIDKMYDDLWKKGIRVNVR